MPRAIRTVLWQRMDEPSSEYCSLLADANGWQLRGTVVAALEGRPVRVRYGIICDEAWRTRAVHIAQRSGGPEQALHLAVDEEGRWWSGQQEIPALRGCIDIDLGITPATNTLPIRRLQLAVGASAQLRAAWVRFPSLEVQPLDQTYTRYDENNYQYQSTNFAAPLEVDDLSLVIRYGDIWQRVGMV